MLKSLYARLALAAALIASGLLVATGTPALARPVCGTNYICAYDDLGGTSLLFKLVYTSWAQSVCYPMGRYDNRISYIVNDSGHNLVVSDNDSCSGTTAPVYAYTYGPMDSFWNNRISASFRVD